MSEPKQTPPAAKPAAAKPNLLATVKTLQFAWYVGHVITVVSTIFYTLTYIKIFPKSYKFWYKSALFGVIESFGVLIYQSVRKSGANIAVLIKEDNVQYLFLGVALFVDSPYVLLTLSTFFLFSTFHVLSYTKHYLLPAFNVPETSPISVKMGEFASANNNKSIQLASVLEVYTLFWMFLRFITFRKTSLVPFLVYVVFMKLRFEKSAFTRNAFKSVEIRIEDVVNKTGVPAVKEAWFKAKTVFAKIGAFHILHDYTKEKST